MKKLFACFLALASAAAFGTTTVPVQLLNSAGSSSGQTIVSTGASSAPGWANVAVSSLSGLGTGVGAALGNAVTGSGGAVLATSPTITTPNLQGVKNGATAVSGQVGQVITNTGTGVSVSSGTAANCTSITLTAGDWDVWGNVSFVPGSGTSQTAILASTSSVSATLANPPYVAVLQAAFPTNAGQSLSVSPLIVNTTSTITEYLVAQASFSGGTESVTCILNARRRN